MKYFIICLILLTNLLLFAHDADAQTRRETRFSKSQLCSGDDPRVTVRLATAKTKYIKSNDVFDLTSMHNTGSGITLGLAGGPIDITAQYEFRMATLNGKTCVQLNKLEVLFWAKPEVHIASNFKKGTCEYREVLGHEQKHIRTLRKFVREYAPKLKKEVPKIVDTSPTRRTVKERDIEKAQDDIMKNISARLFAYQKKIMPVLRSRQEAIDTPEEYRRVADRCDNWGRRIAGG
jgi:hypothetical protein